MAGKEPTRPNLLVNPESLSMTSLEVKFLTCSTVDFAKSRHLVIRIVRKIIRHFQRYGTLSAFSHSGSEPRKVTDDVLQCIKI